MVSSDDGLNAAGDTTGAESTDDAAAQGPGSAGGRPGVGETVGDFSVQITSGTLVVDATIEAGQVVQIADADADDTVVATFMTSKPIGNIVYSSAEVTNGKEYTAYVGGTTSSDDLGGLASSGQLGSATAWVTATAGEAAVGARGGGPQGGGMSGGPPGRPATAVGHPTRSAFSPRAIHCSDRKKVVLVHWNLVLYCDTCHTQ